MYDVPEYLKFRSCDWACTSDRPINSRMLCQLSYAGMSAVFEISLAHKSHILHACHEKANYMRVGHVALNSAESDSSDTISYSQKPNADIH